MRGIDLHGTHADGMARGTRQSSGAFAASCLIHLAVIGCLVALDPPLLPLHASPTVYDQLIKPEEKKLVWYPVKQLPRIDPVEKIGDSATPRGEEKRNEVIISLDPGAARARQVVLRNDVKKALEKETPSPNMVAVKAPAQKLPARKAFQPPPIEAQPLRRAKMVAPPEPPIAPRAPAGAGLDTLIRALPNVPKIRRGFVPPPVRQTKAKLTEPLTDLSAPEIETGPGVGSQVAGENALAKSVTRLPSRPFVAPSAGKAATGKPSMALPDPDAGTGGAISAAVLSTSPLNDLLAPLPDGFRRGNLSAAPTVGPASSGAGGHGGPQAPGLVLQPGNLAALPLPTDMGSLIYQETRASSLRLTLSAPLRPSSRTIPQAIENRFRGRTVYTMIVAAPRLPMYVGDWTMWFAERSNPGGANSPVRAPLPVRKFGLAGALPEIGPSGRIQLSAIILRSGRVDAVEILDKSGLSDKSPPISKQAAIADFRHWQFSPAIRDGLPVDVDVVIEISYQ